MKQNLKDRHPIRNQNLTGDYIKDVNIFINYINKLETKLEDLSNRVKYLEAKHNSDNSFW